MGLIKGVHHIALKCCGAEEYTRTVAFYRDILGLPVVRQWDTGIMLDMGNSVMEIFKDGQQRLGQGTIRHFALRTQDVDACVEAVSKAGYEVFIEPNDIVISSNPVFPARIAFCKGPVGEEIEFFKEL